MIRPSQKSSRRIPGETSSSDATATLANEDGAYSAAWMLKGGLSKTHVSE